MFKFKFPKLGARRDSEEYVDYGGYYYEDDEDFFEDEEEEVYREDRRVIPTKFKEYGLSRGRFRQHRNIGGVVDGKKDNLGRFYC